MNTLSMQALCHSKKDLSKIFFVHDFCFKDGSTEGKALLNLSKCIQVLAINICCSHLNLPYQPK